MSNLEKNGEKKLRRDEQDDKFSVNYASDRVRISSGKSKNSETIPSGTKDNRKRNSVEDIGEPSPSKAARTDPSPPGSPDAGSGRRTGEELRGSESGSDDEGMAECSPDSRRSFERLGQYGLSGTELEDEKKDKHEMAVALESLQSEDPKLGTILRMLKSMNDRRMMAMSGRIYELEEKFKKNDGAFRALRFNFDEMYKNIVDGIYTFDNNGKKVYTLRPHEMLSQTVGTLYAWKAHVDRVVKGPFCSWEMLSLPPKDPTSVRASPYSGIQRAGNY